MAKAKASAPAPANSSVPKGMKVIQGGYAKSWNVEEMATLFGKVSAPPKTVQLTQGKKVTDRQCVEVKTDDGERYTLWESATLAGLFEQLQTATPCMVWVHFKGFGVAKKGQNPPKLFDSAIG